MKNSLALGWILASTITGLTWAGNGEKHKLSPACSKPVYSDAFTSDEDVARHSVSLGGKRVKASPHSVAAQR
ncbi:hypothetical protein [Shewanella chilikensis]|uniref:hypothetical protein n=1 Tax=Shewanella chilikensis TaxID=558541 RepID=UPI001F2F4D47|nr:hypothetical protein [Shewanella chilikensis]MCE9786126.1 hypothetical protein [Shewanella chilikensis]MCE9851821.1 hypothetical protein [Shewanella chilikensis]